jgi:phosphatidylinositol alpha 1,6-mannosyltransferase
MKIAYFAGSLVQNIDGVSRVLYKIAEHNRLCQIPSIYIAPETDPRIGSDSIRLSGIRLPLYSEYKLSTSTVAEVAAKLRLQNFEPDLIHVHSPCTAGRAGLMLGKKLGVPIIATCHTNFPAYLPYHKLGILSKPLKKYLQQFYNACDLVLVPSYSHEAELHTWGVKNTRVLPHGVDTDVFNPERYQEALRPKSGRTVLLYAGRLVREKNLHLLAEAIRKIAAYRQDFELWIAGTGIIEKELQNLLKNAVFWGFCDSQKLAELYASADIFIFPSQSETFGNVTLEAMASQTCCIAADAGGTKDLIVHRQNGWLFDGTHASALAQGLETLLDDASLRHRLAQQALTSSRQYHWPAILSQQIQYYKQLTGNAV